MHMAENDKYSVERRHLLKGLGASAAATILAGCSGNQDGSDGEDGGGGTTTMTTGGDSTPTQTKTPTPKPSEVTRGGTLQVAAAGDPQNLDPHTTTINVAQLVLDNVVENLFEIDRNLDLQPVLAKDFSVSSDNTEYEVTLKEGVKFHDGTDFTSADVKYSINRILNPDLGSPRAANFKLVDSIETPDDYTVRFTLKKPFAPFRIALAESAAIVPEGAGDEYKLKQNPVGTGPFKLKNWKTDDVVSLTKFDNYHESKLPYLDGVKFNVIPEAATRLTQLQSGGANVMFGVPFQKAGSIQSASNTQLQTSPGLWKQALWFNTDEEPFDDPKVRRAISHGINRKQLVAGVLFGHGRVAHSPAVPASSWREEMSLGEKHEYSRQKAKSMLKEAGHEPSSIEMSIKASRTPGPTYADTATLIQSQLSQLGMKVNVKIMDFSTWLQEAWVNKNFELSVGSWSGRIDPDGWYYRQYHSEGAWNRFNYSNSEVDDLLEEGRTTTDRARRAEIYSEIDKITSREVPMDYLYFRKEMAGIESTVGGYSLSPAHKAEFESTYLKE